MQSSWNRGRSSSPPLSAQLSPPLPDLPSYPRPPRRRRRRSPSLLPLRLSARQSRPPVHHGISLPSPALRSPIFSPPVPARRRRRRRASHPPNQQCATPPLPSHPAAGPAAGGAPPIHQIGASGRPAPPSFWPHAPVNQTGAPSLPYASEHEEKV
ncbi:hypothetical protein ACP70R_040303 [Stipagrostis hirtigluma subsp. patula]